MVVNSVQVSMVFRATRQGNPNRAHPLICAPRTGCACGRAHGSHQTTGAVRPDCPSSGEILSIIAVFAETLTPKCRQSVGMHIL